MVMKGTVDLSSTHSFLHDVTYCMNKIVENIHFTSINKLSFSLQKKTEEIVSVRTEEVSPVQRRPGRCWLLTVHQRLGKFPRLIQILYQNLRGNRRWKK